MTKLTYLWHTITSYFTTNTKPKKTLSHLPRSRKHWTDEEISDLLRMHTCYNTPIHVIADELDRPIAGVRSKLISLGYSTRKES